ncbi:MAG: anaerobic ribonucleoside-triphosphate reductase activating protein [Clostridiales bacterium]|nr:anaerobic ribonucleoside-triphosphate reductase activating protein [Clostridiales bacterium]MDD6539514.1 anaerobic ribonucleoside-triphosphate reductase activating protein [Bacillota bacterium]
MYYGKIKNCDIANGPGVRVTLFVSGCTNHCPNCFQPETWDFEFGSEFTDETLEEIIGLMDKSYIKGLTVLGGEPMEPRNQVELLPVLEKVKNRLPDKNIWIYSGFTYEQLKEEGTYCRTEVTDRILEIADVLVDGRYVDALKDLRLKFRGSSNQRIIDLKGSREADRIQLLDL